MFQLPGGDFHMSFSTDVKLELAHVMPTKGCCVLAELGAVLRVQGVTSGEAEGGPGGQGDMESFTLRASHPAVARKIYILMKRAGAEATLAEDQPKGRSVRKRGVRVRAQGGGADLIKAVERAIDGPLAWESFPRDRCCRRAYVRGAFLCRGSLSSPQKDYHFEIVLDRESVARSLAASLESLGLHPGITKRKESFLVYLKEGEGIVEVLSLMGAHQALLKLENVRIVKGMRNRVNRLVNCETANVDKTVKAAMTQLEAIRSIDRIEGLENLPLALKSLARARLEHPYASLRELGEMMQPKVSKSGVSHRMRRLMSHAEKLDPRGVEEKES